MSISTKAAILKKHFKLQLGEKLFYYSPFCNPAVLRVRLDVDLAVPIGRETATKAVFSVLKVRGLDASFVRRFCGSVVLTRPLGRVDDTCRGPSRA